MSLRDKINPVFLDDIRIMVYFWAVLFGAVLAWIFYQEYLALDFLV